MVTKSSKKKSIKVGVVGSKTVTKKAVASLLSDFVPQQQKRGDVSFVLPITKELFTPGVALVADYLTDNDIPFEVLTDAASKKVRPHKPYLGNATKVTERRRGLVQAIVTVAGSSDEPKLVVLYDEDDAAVEKALEKAFEVEMPVLDLASGMREVELSDDDEEDSDDEGEDDADEEEGDEEEGEEESGDESEDDESDESEDDDEDDEEPEPAPTSKSKKAAASTNGAVTEESEAMVRMLLKEIGQALIEAAAE